MENKIYKKPIELPTLEQLKMLLKENEEKEKLAAELIIANKELAFQNEEKEKRATASSEEHTSELQSQR